MNIKRLIEVTEKIFLVLIAGFTIAAMFQEVMRLVDHHQIELKDLLLMFIYAEVLGMLAAFYSSSKIPITIPLFIAMTALSRLIILQGKEGDPSILLYESGAILMIALLVIPAAAARFWTHRVGVMVVVAAVLGGVSCLFGSLLSAAAEDLPSGATIVLVAAAIFGFSMVLGSERGLWWRLRAHRAHRDLAREVAIAPQAGTSLGQRSGGS